jgi:plastocyanin
MPSRRQLMKGVGAATFAFPLAGCSSGEGSTEEETTEETTAESTDQTTEGGGGTDAAVVAVGPEKRLRFEPEEVEVSVGETVAWEFESEGHNVTSKPGASPKCENPEGAEPFASYDGDEHFAINEVGTTFTHTFDVAGEYVYVCTPHAGQGMVGTVTVTE